MRTCHRDQPETGCNGGWDIDDIDVACKQGAIGATDGHDTATGHVVECRISDMALEIECHDLILEFIVTRQGLDKRSGTRER